MMSRVVLEAAMMLAYIQSLPDSYSARGVIEESISTPGTWAYRVTELLRTYELPVLADSGVEVVRDDPKERKAGLREYRKDVLAPALRERDVAHWKEAVVAEPALAAPVGYASLNPEPFCHEVMLDPTEVRHED